MCITDCRNNLIRAMWRTIYSREVRDEIHKFEPVFSTIQLDDLNHYLSQSSEDPCRVSYASKQEYRFNLDKRTKTSLGRYLKRNYGSIMTDITDKDLSDFVAKVLSYLPGTCKDFTLLKGDKIEEAYKNEIGGHSCMTGECSMYTRIYAENSNVSMLVLGREARALVWKTNEGPTLLDRIYPNDGQHIELFRKYAIDNNWAVRFHNGPPSTTINFIDKDGTIYSKFTVTLELPSNEQYPYLDSFRYVLGTDPLVLTNCNTDESYNITLDSTEGDFPEINYCEGCGHLVRFYAIVNVEDHIYCDHCAHLCNDCGDSFINENLTIVDGYYCCDSCLERNYTECYHCNEIVSNEDRIIHNDSYCENCFDQLFFRCHECDSTVEREDELEYEGNSYCPKCYDKIDEERVESGQFMSY